MKILILLSVVSLAFASERVCGQNQRYLQCGTACPLTCDNYANPPEICIAMCVSGCHCEKGYVKTADGRCVRPEECPARDNPSLKTCVEKPDGGMCEAYMPMWYYDAQEGTCKRFVYGGCQGNSNRYATREECTQNCGRYRVSSTASLKTCVEKPDSGICEAYMPMWYYDKEAGTCKSFIYGGCQGNSNRYATREECTQNCGNIVKLSSSKVCDLPADPGTCYAYMPRFFFDSSRGECVRFIYGGCAGNTNNFKTIEECQSVCA